MGTRKEMLRLVILTILGVAIVAGVGPTDRRSGPNPHQRRPGYPNPPQGRPIYTRPVTRPLKPKLANRLCYGDIKKLSPTGKKNGGVAKSQIDVKNDVPHLEKYKACFQKMADKFCIQASVIAAIASRESRGGSYLDKKGYGDKGRAIGIMQCDLKHSGLPCLSKAWNSCEHIEMMTEKILISFIKQVKKKFPKWPAERQLQGGVAAYNFGVSNVRSWDGLDDGSTGNDYSNDVIARAKWLLSKDWK